jgi:hypothetical protein
LIGGEEVKRSILTNDPDLATFYSNLGIADMDSLEGIYELAILAADIYITHDIKKSLIALKIANISQ